MAFDNATFEAMVCGGGSVIEITHTLADAAACRSWIVERLKANGNLDYGSYRIRLDDASWSRVTRAAIPPDIFTEDGAEIKEGMRLFNYYDGQWGTVGTIDHEGWFDFIHDDGGHRYLNGQRVATYNPEA